MSKLPRYVLSPTSNETFTALEVLKRSDVPTEDRLQTVLIGGWIPDSIRHEFALWCAEQALAMIQRPDPRSIAALEVKRRWLRKEATDEELNNSIEYSNMAYVQSDSAQYKHAPLISGCAASRAAVSIDSSSAASGASLAHATTAGHAAEFEFWERSKNDRTFSAPRSAVNSMSYAAARAARDAQATHLIALLEAYERENTQ